MMTTTKKVFFLLLLFLLSLGTRAQIYQPVKFTVEEKKTSSTEIEITFNGTIEDGWHVYSTDLPKGGPISASITIEKLIGAKPKGKLQALGKEIGAYDKIFEMKLRYFETSVTFKQRYTLTSEQYEISGYLEYGACNDEMCLPPKSVDFSYKSSSNTASAQIKEQEKTDAAKLKQEENITIAQSDSVPQTSYSNAQNSLWQPVIKEIRNLEGKNNTTNKSLLYVFIMGFVGGLIALFTPCVWPIIPMTVSFFLKRAKDNKKKGIREAITYGIAIIVIYLTLGLSITALFSASALNALSTSAVFNLIFCALLIIFAISFFGWFDIRLPQSWGNNVDTKASDTTGVLSIFLMAATLAIVSFSCTGPVIGFLLVEVSTTGNILSPAIGMLGFSIALALPFTLFALFPTMLKSAPKSGGWMNIIKVTLGFIELAFALKFFSVADLAYGWRLLDREVFFAIWIALFGVLGLYLIGLIKFPHDDLEKRAMPVPCIVLGIVSLAFTIYLIPGLWGAPCKAVSAFAPPMSTQDFSFYHNEVTAQYKDYDEGMAAAKREGKPVLIDFTGFGCVNCRKMEASVWTDARVKDRLNNDYILISLYVDDKTPLPTPMEVMENGSTIKLRTIGDKWSYLQRSKFGANAQPFYIALDNEGKPLTAPYAYDESIDNYLAFLNRGLKGIR